MPNGYNGRILKVNLTDGSWDIDEPEEAFYRKYLGGSALGVIVGALLIVFIVLLITDILGYTDIFPFVKKHPKK